MYGILSVGIVFEMDKVLKVDLASGVIEHCSALKTVLVLTRAFGLRLTGTNLFLMWLSILSFNNFSISEPVIGRIGTDYLRTLRSTFGADPNSNSVSGLNFWLTSISNFSTNTYF